MTPELERDVNHFYRLNDKLNTLLREAYKLDIIFPNEGKDNMIALSQVSIKVPLQDPRFPSLNSGPGDEEELIWLIHSGHKIFTTLMEMIEWIHMMQNNHQLAYKINFLRVQNPILKDHKYLRVSVNLSQPLHRPKKKNHDALKIELFKINDGAIWVGEKPDWIEADK